jgi:inositol hexakisphosphate/diphosphoinositol-pentakisphosphate kinase
LIDLRNTREEAISVAELKQKQGHVPGRVRKHLEEGNRISGKVRVAVDSSRQNCSTDKSYETDDDDDKETQYRLDPK